MDNKYLKLDSAVLYTSDLNRSIDFYRDLLGWNVEYIQDGRFVSFTFGNAKVGIKQKREDREQPGYQTVFIACSDIDSYYKNLKGKGVVMLKDLVDEDWARNFSFLDPDGNKVQYIQQHINS